MKPGARVAIKIKRVYDAPAASDGKRILVDRLWPRGIAKAQADIAHWAKSISPSNELRKWYGHDPEKWEEFRLRYFAELDANPDGMRELLAHLDTRAATFLFSSKELLINNAAALKDYVEARLG
ncbi:MAG TPA: DUF488 family protein [Paucimonas sp.]|nr:DUF488 family protein [Paucimonas sp.]